MIDNSPTSVSSSALSVFAQDPSAVFPLLANTGSRGSGTAAEVRRPVSGGRTNNGRKISVVVVGCRRQSRLGRGQRSSPMLVCHSASEWPVPPNALLEYHVARPSVRAAAPPTMRLDGWLGINEALSSR